MDGHIAVVHRPSPTGGRRVTVRGTIVGLAHSDRDLVEFLRQSGVEETDAEDLVHGDSNLIKWRGGRPREYDPE